MKVLGALALGVIGLSVAGCVDMAPVQERVLSTHYEQRFTDEAIRRDWRAIEALRGRIDDLRGEHATTYELWRSELMLAFGVHEYEENDRTTIADALLDEADRTARRLRAGIPEPSGHALARLPAMKVLREELWTEVHEAKDNSALRTCAGEQIARLEIGLLELGHNHWEVDAGMNTIEHLEPCPFEPLVDDLAADLRETVARCTELANRRVPEVELISLPADVLFAFDRCDVNDMLPEGRKQLDALAGTLALEHRGWSRLVIAGHTDRLGSMHYNLKLSRCRAETVRDYLVQRFGLPAEQMEVRGLGPLEPVTFCNGPINDALKDCLQPNRRVTVRVHR